MTVGCCKSECFCRWTVCFKVFDGVSGEVKFVPPNLPEGEISHPVSGINVKPMANAELPTQAAGKPWMAIILLLALLATLAVQLYLPAGFNGRPNQPVELSQIVVRPHPDVEGALRLDAVLQRIEPRGAAVVAGGVRGDGVLGDPDGH